MSVLNLNKGGVLNLTKTAPALSKVIFAAGWDVSRFSGSAYDLDISAFLLNSQGKLASGEDVVFFNNKQRFGVELEGDNRTGEGDGDDERIFVDLNSIPQSVEKVVFVVNIFDAKNKRQTFQNVENSYIRLVDELTDSEIARYSLRDNFSLETAVILGELYRSPGGWEFKALGEGLVVDDLNVIAGRYL